MLKLLKSRDLGSSQPFLPTPRLYNTEPSLVNKVLLMRLNPFLTNTAVVFILLRNRV
jgi:hypothetical protein